MGALGEGSSWNLRVRLAAASGNLEIWEFGNLGIWRSEDLEIQKFGDLGTWTIQKFGVQKMNE